MSAFNSFAGKDCELHGVMESMKSQIPSTKLQTNIKFQYSMTKTQNRFGISNFGHCDLFDICYLLFGISIPP